MRPIIDELRLFLKKDFNLRAYVAVGLFISTILILNFTFSFERNYINRYYAKPTGSLVYFFYYALPYYFAVIVSLSFKKHLHKLRQKDFWIKSSLFIFIFAFFTASAYHKYPTAWVANTVEENNYLLKVFGNLKRIVPLILLFALIKYIFDKKDNHIYGLHFRKTNYRPYFIMLLLVIPLVTFASFTESFQAAYPRFKPWQYEGLFNFSEFQKVMVFELAYGLDFISIELMFRGAMIIGLAKALKEDAILPAAALYVVIHFGKPPLEAVSSFFGGFILGVHAYYSKHIIGGIIVHIGLAWLMEVAAHLQHFFR